MRTALHIIEPTLTGLAGHCHSLVRALVDAAPECDVTVWAGRGGLEDWQPPGRLVPYFNRRWRRLQGLWLMRRLLRAGSPILVATAGSADLVVADWAAAGPIAPQRLFLFVHWLGNKPGKARRLAAIAKRQPQLEILAPTAAVAEFFTNCGFKTTLVPYPLAIGAANPVPPAKPAAFKHLLVAGGARLDKGFAEIVDLVAHLQACGMQWPITVQTSTEARHRGDPALQAQLSRLRGLGYSGLTMIDDAMSPEAYQALFSGALVLQPYRAQDFDDRVSGVTLDALRAGAPLVVTAGTWMARQVQGFEAGVVTADLSAPGLLRAINTLLADHARFAAHALQAAAAVAGAHSARALLDVVLQRGGR